MQSDTYSTIGLVIGLLLLLLTKIAWLDSAIAFIFGSIIIFTGYKILKETTSNLMDKADSKILESISEILQKNKSNNWIDIHNLKPVKYGDAYHIDCDLTFPRYMTVEDAHKESDLIKKFISENYSLNVDFTIHTDACKNDMCVLCKIPECKFRKQDFKTEVKWTVENLTKPGAVKEE